MKQFLLLESQFAGKLEVALKRQQESCNNGFVCLALLFCKLRMQLKEEVWKARQNNEDTVLASLLPVG